MKLSKALLSKQSDEALSGDVTAEFSQNNYLSFTQSANNSDSSFLFSAWIYVDDLTETNYILSSSNGSATDPRMGFRTDVDGRLVLAVNRTGSEWAFFQTATGVISTGQWYHVMVSNHTGSNKNVTMYVNGKPIDLPSYGTQFSSFNSIGISGYDIGLGCYIYSPNEANHTFSGRISNVNIGDSYYIDFSDYNIEPPESFYTFNSDGTISPRLEPQVNSTFYSNVGNFGFRNIQTSDIGTDQSANGNDFTTTGTISVGSESISVTPDAPLIVSHGTTSTGTIEFEGALAGDLLVAFLGADSASQSTPSGWTQRFYYRSSFTLSAGVYTKVATGGDTQSLSSFGWSDGSGIVNWFVIRGHNSFKFIDDALNSSGDPIPTPLPTMTASNNGELVLALGFLDDDIATLNRNPQGYTGLDFDTYGVSGNGGTIMSAFVHYSHGSTENLGGFYTAFDTSGSDYNIGITIVID